MSRFLILVRVIGPMIEAVEYELRRRIEETFIVKLETILPLLHRNIAERVTCPESTTTSSVVSVHPTDYFNLMDNSTFQMEELCQKIGTQKHI